MVGRFLHLFQAVKTLSQNSGLGKIELRGRVHALACARSWVLTVELQTVGGDRRGQNLLLLLFSFGALVLLLF